MIDELRDIKPMVPDIQQGEIDGIKEARDNIDNLREHLLKAHMIPKEYFGRKEND